MKKVVCLVALVVFAGYFLHHYRGYRKMAAEVDSFNSLVEEANECLATYDWKCAERSTRALLKEKPDDEVLQTNLAWILLEEERYGECLAYIDGLSIHSDNLDMMKQKAKLLQQEMEELHLEKSFHFRLEYDGNPSRSNVMEALAVLEVAYDSLSTLFDFRLENKIALVLYQAANHTGIGPRPDWVGAVFDGKLRVPENVMDYSGVYRPMLFHELTHCFLRGMTHSQIPFWVNEGIAQVVDASRNDVEKPAGAKPSLKDLENAFVQQDRRDVAEKLYWYSQKMVEGMLARNGSLVYFRKYIQDLKKMGNEKALKQYYGVTAEQLLEEVR